jgi:hypothetical protein
MFDIKKSGRRGVSIVALAMVVGGCGALLVGCQTATLDVSDPEPTVVVERPAAPLPADLRGLPADRIEQELAERAAAQRELAEQFDGVPVDRIVEQLEREARG